MKDMTADNCVKYPFCVEWTVKLPPDNIFRRTSSNIFFEGFELKLELSRRMKIFNLRMFVQNTESTLEKMITCSTNTYAIHPKSDERKLIGYSTYFNFSEGKDLVSGYWKTIWTRSREAFTNVTCGFYFDDTLTIHCEFHIKNIQTQVSTQSALNRNTANLQILSRDFSTFLKDETFSDVKLQCADDRIFSAHRSVLAARSEVFAAMFRNQMAEKKSGTVHIKDVDPEVLELLLQYMYSAEWPDLCEETAHRLYEAADKYSVHGLRRVCSEWMAERQTTDNCLDLLVLAEQHSDEIFKEAVVCFVAEYLPDISIESWSIFREKYPPLVLLVLEKRCEDSMPGRSNSAKH